MQETKQQNEWLLEYIKRSKIKRSVLCDEVGIARNTLYRYIQGAPIPASKKKEIKAFFERLTQTNTNEDFEEKYKILSQMYSDLMIENQRLKNELEKCTGTVSGQMLHK